MKHRFVLLTLLTAAVILVPYVASVGTAQGAGLSIPYGFRTPDGSFVIPYYQELLGDQGLSPGILVFGDAIDIEFINSEGNRTIQVTAFQNGSGDGVQSQWANATYTVEGYAITVLPTFDLPSSGLTLPVQLCVDGGCMNFLHETPITLVPIGVLTSGGLDLIAFSVTLETLALMTPLTFLARRLTHKALWSPKIQWWLVLPHLCFAFLILFSVEFPPLDMAFSGLEFVLFPIVIAFLWFFFVMHLFNIATPVEADQVAPSTAGRPGMTKWWLLIGVLPNGQWIAIGTRWRDWFARLRGKAPVLYDPTKGSGKDPPPHALEVTPKKLGHPDAIWNAQRHEWQTFRGEAGRESPFQSFPITNVRVPGIDAAPRRELPMLQLWVDHDQWLSIKLPYLSWHREEKVRAEFSPEGKLLHKARIRRRLTWPHYVTPTPVTGLSAVHFEEPLAAWLRYLEQERAYILIEQLRRQLYQLLTGVHVLADASTERTVREIFELLERERFPITPEESREEIQRSEGKPLRPGERDGGAESEDEDDESSGVAS